MSEVHRPPSAENVLRLVQALPPEEFQRLLTLPPFDNFMSKQEVGELIHDVLMLAKEKRLLTEAIVQALKQAQANRNRKPDPATRELYRKVLQLRRENPRYWSHTRLAKHFDHRSPSWVRYALREAAEDERTRRN
jgi:hypothetical protein